MHRPVALAHYQLKYCERCGGLWLRPDGAATVYCPPCEAVINELPRRIRPPKRKTIQAACAPAPLSVASELSQRDSRCLA